MSAIFADAAYFVALFNPRDGAHQRARQLTFGLARPILTTPWVLAEVAAYFATPPQRRIFVELMARIDGREGAEVVPPSADLFRRGVELYRDRPDKEWSLADCISFIVMRDRGILEALTTDRHFEQAGFTALIR